MRGRSASRKSRVKLIRLTSTSISRSASCQRKERNRSNKSRPVNAMSASSPLDAHSPSRRPERQAVEKTTLGRVFSLARNGSQVHYEQERSLPSPRTPAFHGARVVLPGRSPTHRLSGRSSGNGGLDALLHRRDAHS